MRVGQYSEIENVDVAVNTSPSPAAGSFDVIRTGLVEIRDLKEKSSLQGKVRLPTRRCKIHNRHVDDQSRGFGT